jgi:hypothetical protein
MKSKRLPKEYWRDALLFAWCPGANDPKPGFCDFTVSAICQLFALIDQAEDTPEGRKKIEEYIKEKGLVPSPVPTVYGVTVKGKKVELHGPPEETSLSA